MTLADFLNYALSPVGAGVILWAVMALIIKLSPTLDANSDAKFWITFVVAFAIPPLAYWARIALGYDVFNAEGLFLAVGAGYITSQAVHRGTENIQGKSGNTPAATAVANEAGVVNDPNAPGL